MKILILATLFFSSLTHATYVEQLGGSELSILALKAEEKVPFQRAEDNPLLIKRSIEVCEYEGFTEVIDFRLRDVEEAEYLSEIIDLAVEKVRQKPVKVFFRAINPIAFEWIDCQ